MVPALRRAKSQPPDLSLAIPAPLRKQTSAPALVMTANVATMARV
jgi:hypothetical protein